MEFWWKQTSYSYGGKTYNRGGYIARPSRGAIERANRAGALTRSEYSRLRSEFRDVDEDNFADRWSSGGSRASYSYGGKTYNRGGYIARPSRGAIERANRAGALTRSEYSRLRSEFRDVDEDNSVGDRWSSGGSRASYSYGGKTYNRGGYIARPSRGAIERANRAGALTQK